VRRLITPKGCSKKKDKTQKEHNLIYILMLFGLFLFALLIIFSINILI